MHCSKSILKSTLIGLCSPLQTCMLCRPAVISARFTLTIIEMVLWETGNPFRAVWAKVQITSTIVTSGLSRSSSTGLPLEAAAECVPDVDPAVGRPDTLRHASHNVCPHPAYRSGALPHVLLAHRFSVSVIMSVTYGYNMDEGETFVNRCSVLETSFSVLPPPKDPRRATRFRSVGVGHFIRRPPIFYQDLSPVAMNLPAWLPRVGPKYETPEGRRLSSETLHAPYAFVERRIVRPKIGDHMCLADRERSIVHGR